MDFSQIAYDPKYFTTKGLSFLCNLNRISDWTNLRAECFCPMRSSFNGSLHYNDYSKGYYEVALSHATDVKMDGIFLGFKKKYFTVEGIKLYCTLHNIDQNECVTRNDFCTRIGNQ